MIQERESRRHRGLKVFVLLCALMIIALPAMAAKGGNATGSKGHGGGGGTTGSGGGTISLKMVTDVNGNGLPDYGDTVTFNVSTTVTDKPYVVLGCTQGGASVYQSSYTVGFYPDYPWPWLQNFALTSQAWTGGAASCTATLEYLNGSKWAVIDTLPFNVGA